MVAENKCTIVAIQPLVYSLCVTRFEMLCSIPPRRGLASVGVGVLGAPDPAPEAVTNYYVTPPPPLEDSPSQKPSMQPFKMIPIEF